MRYFALATDFDGTLATDGIVDASTIAALERLRSSGRKLIMVTGREMKDLKPLFQRMDLFEWIVAENGAELYRPSNDERIYLGEPPLPNFVEELKKRGVKNISVGGCIVATWEPYENIVLSTIRDLGLELKVVFNKGAIMVLPAEINKATGLMAALKHMELSPHEIVGVGDAENDHAFLSICGCSAAVANALLSVKQRADIQLTKDHGAGVIQLIDAVLKDDLQKKYPHGDQLLFGKQPDGSDYYIKSYHNALLIAGSSGSGKSTVATGIMEQLSRLDYQYCIIDPEGDFATFEDAIILGDASHAPSTDEILQVLKNSDSNVVVNMVGVRLADRPQFFSKLFGRLLELRTMCGRPHWILIDEAHHLLPAQWKPTSIALPNELSQLILITVHPQEVSKEILKHMKIVIAVGKEPEDVLNGFTEALGSTKIDFALADKKDTEVVVWSKKLGQACFVTPKKCVSERRRHIRKYMSGELPIEKSFFFEGPKKKLHLRAQNLLLFMQLSNGVDDETWSYHLDKGDISTWFADHIKDQELAMSAKAIQKRHLSPKDSRAEICQLIEMRYTLPTTSHLPLPGTAAAAKEPLGASKKRPK